MATAAAAEQMSANIAGVNRNLEQVNGAVSTVTQSIDRLTDSVDAIRRRCDIASKRSEQANNNVREALSVMERLSKAASEIGDVVELINDVADQTNMLSLNASIEAATAGSAGQGFAVVANEIKALAHQTAESTRVIETKIHGIQDQSNDASSAMKGISRIIDDIVQANADIDQAVGEQLGHAQEIDSSMTGVSNAAEEVTINAQELEAAAGEVARAMAEAARGAEEIASTSNSAAQAARDVAGESVNARHFSNEIAQSAETTEQDSNKVHLRMGQSYARMGRLSAVSGHLGWTVEDIERASTALRDAQAGLRIGEPLFNVGQAKSTHLRLLDDLQRVIQIQTAPEEADQPSSLSIPELTNLRDGITASNNNSRHPDDVLEARNAALAKAKDVIENAQTNQIDKAQSALNQFNQKRKELFERLDAWYLMSSSSQDKED